MLRLVLLLACVACLGADRPPNVVLILVDDLGYGDLGCFGAKDIRTPQLDRLAAQGTRFTDFYVAQAVCTASRAALLTGCYPNRVGMQGALNHTSRFGLNPSEWTLPKMLKDRGYATACFGKWHLGTAPELSAPRQGFDEFFGLPYSNDNSKYHPTLAAEMPPLPLLDGEKVAELDPDQSAFTARFTAKGLDFIERHKDRPFFLYLPHVMPHVPIFASAKFKGRSARGVYGDVVEELDDAIGTILAKLRDTGLEKDTLVLFFSDNGAWMSYGEHAGSNGPLREGKLTCFEGGVRSPLLVRWPGKVPAGRVSGTPFMSIDLLPTLVEAVGGKSPTLRIDGRSALPLLRGIDDTPTHEALFFYAGEELHAVRAGRWKLHFDHPYLSNRGLPGRGGKPSGHGTYEPLPIADSSMDAIASRHGQKVSHQPQALFDLTTDPGETRDLSAQHPEIVRRLAALAEPVRADLGDKLTGVAGGGRRPAGQAPAK
ncbi:MAG: Arylsulfatase [Verrucomicrobiota bacterium]|jgi:arylsulfatase